MLSEMQIKSISYFPTSDLWNKYSGRTISLEMDPFIAFSFSFFVVILYWNIFAFQFVSVCSTMSLINSMYTHILSLVSLPPTPSLHHSRSHPSKFISLHLEQFSAPIQFTHGSVYMGFPVDTVVKNLPANAGDTDSISGLGRPLSGCQ